VARPYSMGRLCTLAHFILSMLLCNVVTNLLFRHKLWYCHAAVVTFYTLLNLCMPYILFTTYYLPVTHHHSLLHNVEIFYQTVLIMPLLYRALQLFHNPHLQTFLPPQLIRTT